MVRHRRVPRDCFVTIRVRPGERMLIEHAATESGTSISDFIRGNAVKTAREQLRPVVAPDASDDEPDSGQD